MVNNCALHRHQQIRHDCEFNDELSCEKQARMRNKYFKRRLGYALPWLFKYSPRKSSTFSASKGILLILVLTSLWWISFDILFILHRQSAFDSIADDVIKHEERRHVGTFTPPQRRQFMRLPSPILEMKTERAKETNIHNKIHDGNQEDSLLGRIKLELYPDKVIPLLGNGGLPAYLPNRLKTLSIQTFDQHSFDSVLSDRISLNRRLNDFRGEKCQQKELTYSNNLPHTSVVICFHNEALSALLRTVHSVINRTPPHLLASIVLVDDASTIDDLNEHLDSYINNLNRKWEAKVILLRNEERQGLVRSRLKGAAIANGDVLTFLDSHCEVTKGWIKPLLHRIKQDKKNVVCPVIEVIDSEDFSYKNAQPHQIVQVGGFTWDLFFEWRSISPDEQKLRLDETYPMKSPTMAGGLFAIDRAYFYHIGSYDDQMEIWGGENLEMSFRIWMCGGNLEIIPCSRVGHIFRKENSPYSFPGGVKKTLNRNFNRLAEVWMDDYKEVYYRRKSSSERTIDIGDVSSRRKLRNSLQCKSFDWFLNNIVPDMLKLDLNPPGSGELQHVVSKKCLDSMGQKGNKASIKVFKCHHQGGHQYFVLSKRGEIVYNEASCLDYSVSNENNHVEMWNCHGLGGNQVWEHDMETGLLKHVISQKCLALAEDDFLTVADCKVDGTQEWRFSQYNNKSKT